MFSIQRWAPPPRHLTDHQPLWVRLCVLFWKVLTDIKHKDALIGCWECDLRFEKRRQALRGIRGKGCLWNARLTWRNLLRLKSQTGRDPWSMLGSFLPLTCELSWTLSNNLLLFDQVVTVSADCVKCIQFQFVGHMTFVTSYLCRKPLTWSYRLCHQEAPTSCPDVDE